MNWDELKQKAQDLLIARGLVSEYSERLDKELYEIEKQGANSYWCELVDKDEKFDTNPNGLVLPWLLDLTQIDPVVSGIKHIEVYQTDFPDVDLDFLPLARNTIKEYATSKYVHVCSVGNWVTYKPKSALQDVSRAYGGSNTKAVIELTSNLPDEFDDLSLEDHQKLCKDVDNPDPKIVQAAAQEISRYQPFYDFAIANQKIVSMAYRLVGKIRAQGTHAGGIIIADRPIEEIVPMSYMGKEGEKQWTSQWTEGKKTQLSKFGLVKFDILGVKTIYYIWQAGNLIKKNYDIDIDWSKMDPTSDPPLAGALNMPDGSVESILFNDPESLKCCNELKTDSVFQIETPIQKKIIQNGVVKTFWDLIVYNAMGRPGPMDSIPNYIEQRDDPNQSWRDGEDPKIIDVLEDTSGILCYQEQLSAIWMLLAKFTVPEAEAARKIISKKWVEKLPQVEKQWVDGATKNIGKDKADHWWKLMSTFGRYAFNKCLAGGTIIQDPITYESIPVEKLEGRKDFSLMSFDTKSRKFVPDKVVDLIKCGEQEVFEIEFDNGLKMETTMEHQFYCKDDQYHTVSEIVEKNLEIKIKYYS